MPPQSMLLAVAGMVGTGKTTLTRALARRFGLQMALESVDDENPWLTSFYGPAPEAQREYALRLQLHFLATRFHAMRRMRAAGGGWILDRTWYEDAEIFARGLADAGVLSPHEHALYERLYVELLTGPAARPPRLLIYLHGSLSSFDSESSPLSRLKAGGIFKTHDTKAPNDIWLRSDIGPSSYTSIWKDRNSWRSGVYCTTFTHNAVTICRHKLTRR